MDWQGQAGHRGFESNGACACLLSVKLSILCFPRAQKLNMEFCNRGREGPGCLLRLAVSSTIGFGIWVSRF